MVRRASLLFCVGIANCVLWDKARAYRGCSLGKQRAARVQDRATKM